MKLYTTQGAPNPQRLDFFLAEKEIVIDREEVTLMERAHDAEDFRKLSPFGLVPVLILDNGQSITEVEAICRYFDEVVPQPNLLGSNPEEKALIGMWSRLTELQLLNPIAQTFRHSHPKMNVLQEQIEAYADLSRRNAMKSLDLFERHMQGREFVVADRFTLADINMFVALRMMKLARMELSSWVTLHAWFTSQRERHCFA
ncbi:MAG: glutathione S-transferase family protein [Alphaproteobacteria bacterium]|jgi:glutathione S-transferase|nr:glutathione S-transferase family protein [Alphaproteobacteria bacterium]